MEGDSLKLNFEIALEKIDTLTKQNNELLDTVDQLENQLEACTLELNSKIIQPSNTSQSRFNCISKEADAAMKRFTAKLRKELDKNGKSKQGKRQPV